MGGGYIEKWSYIFKRKQREDIIIFGDKFIVSFLRRLGVQVDVPVICSVEQSDIGFCNNSIKLHVGLHTLTDLPCRYAINLAGSNRHYWNTGFFAIKWKWEIGDKFTGELQAYNAFGAIRRVCYIFKSAGLYISDVPCDLPSFCKWFVFLIMAQHSLFNTKLSPKIIVDILVICVEVRCTHLNCWCGMPRLARWRIDL